MNYSIEGEPLPVVICNLEANETMITEKGAMSWMSPNMQMETTSNGGIGKMFGRAFSGESMFVNRYTARNGNGLIAFASSFPGSIRAFEIAPGQEIVAQKSAFLASSASVEMSIFFQKRFGSVKELQTEYAKLLEEKKKTYAEYRRSREEMRELLTAKANVDRVLKMEVEQDVEKEKDHGQR